MRGTVHQPRQVHRNHVAGHGGDVPTVGEGVSDQVPGNDGGQQEAQEGHHEDEVPEGGRRGNYLIRWQFKVKLHSLLLEHDHGILLQVAHVDHLALGLHLRVLADQQPAHVGEEEATGRVMGISVSVGELVMHSMVTGPFVDAVLEGDRLQDHQEDAQWQAGLVGLVRPQTMCPGCNAKGGTRAQDETWNEE